MNFRSSLRRVPHRRRGSAYVLILAISTAVVLIGITALHVSHMQFRGASLTRDWSDAQQLAQAGLDTGTAHRQRGYRRRRIRQHGLAAPVQR